MIRASDLAGKRVRRENGEVLGHVFEIRTDGGEVTALICGARGFLQRLADSVSGHRVEWKDVRAVTAREIVVAGPRSRKLRRRSRRRKSKPIA